MTEEKTFDSWAIVELFGHSKIAGKCSEQNVAGTNMLRVDVPEVSEQPPFTRFIGGSAIYAINPVTEEMARAYAESLKVKPIQVWDVNEFINKKAALKLQPAQADVFGQEGDDE